MSGRKTNQTHLQSSSSSPLGEAEVRLWAPLALVLTQPDKVGPCVDDETLVAFHEGRLSQAEETEVREHVGVCAECYERWLEAREWVPQPSPISLLARIKEFFLRGAETGRLGWFGAAGALVAACLILTFSLWYFHSPRLVWDEWTAAELRGLVRLAPGGLVPKHPAGAVEGPRIRGFTVTNFPLAGEDLAAFTAGIRLAAGKLAETEPSWRAVLEYLTDLPALPRGTNGLGRRQDGRELLVALGYWSALVAVACDTVLPAGEVVWQSYALERYRQLERLWSQVQASALAPEVQKTVAAWVQEAAVLKGQNLCRLQPVVLARKLLGGSGS